jgi:hypothetical protein
VLETPPIGEAADTSVVANLGVPLRSGPESLVFTEPEDLPARTAVSIHDPDVVFEHPGRMACNGEKHRPGLGCMPQTSRRAEDPLHRQSGVDRVVAREIGDVRRASGQLSEIPEDLFFGLEGHTREPEAAVLIARNARPDLRDVVMARVRLVWAGYARSHQCALHLIQRYLTHRLDILRFGTTYAAPALGPHRRGGP